MLPQTKFFVANSSKAKQIRCICFPGISYNNAGKLSFFFIGVVTKTKKKSKLTFKKGDLVKAIAVTSKVFNKLNCITTGFFIRQHILKAVVLSKAGVKVELTSFVNTKLDCFLTFFFKQRGLFKVFALSNQKFF